MLRGRLPCNTIDGAQNAHRESIGTASIVAVMTNSLARKMGAALSMTSVAVLGVGALSPAEAAAAGVDTQQLRTVQTSPMRTEASHSPSALPAGGATAVRYLVDAERNLTRVA